VRAEDAAVDVRLVDDDGREVGEERPPGLMVGQDPEVEHVRVGQHQVGLAADRRPALARGVAVVDGHADRVAEVERVERARLVLGERLGGVEVERAGVRVVAQRVERRQVEGERLARSGARGEDHRAVRRRLPRLGLV